MNQTLQDIQDWTSLDNLKKGKPSGQIATLLILVITAMLIFILVVANIGEISNYATNLSNATDAASMYFASQLGTKSYQLSNSLFRSCGNSIRCCVRTGLLSTILSIVVAVLVIILAPYIAPALVGAVSVGEMSIMALVSAGTIGGSIGGAIGGAIAGTGVVRGAIQGAVIGASIGYGMSMGAAAGTYTFLGPTVGASLGASLAVASSIYTAYARDAMLGDAMAAAVRALNGLPEAQRIRESIFLQALSETIDDPNKVADTNDSDGDGNTAELVPNFQYCWDRRITDLKNNNALNLSAAEQAVDQFLIREDSAVGTFLSGVSGFLPHLARQEVESSGDGTVTLLLRALENAGYPVSFWEPGPTAAQLDTWRTQDLNTCPTCEPPEPPAGYDELDYAVDELGSLFKPAINEFRNQIITYLVYNWREWVPWLYDPESPTDPSGAEDYYTFLYSLLNGDSSSNPVRIGLRGWVNEIERLRQGLPVCIYGSDQYDASGNLILPCAGFISSPDCIKTSGNNPPCRGHPNNPNFGSIDEDFADEFQAAKDAINQSIQVVEQFRQDCVDFYNEMERLESQGQLTVLGCGITGINPVTYSWTDSRGNHSITVTQGDYQMPRLVKRKHGNWFRGKKCIELRNHQQDVTVTIERHDPSRVEVGRGGILVFWNPSQGGIIRRRAKAQYKGTVDGWVKLVPY